MYEQIATINMTQNRIIGDLNAAVGQRNARWTVFPLRQFIAQPLIVNSVATTSAGSVNLVSASISNSGTPTISSQSGSWIDSLTDNGVGDTTINIALGVFAQAPVCVVTLVNVAGFGIINGAVTTSAINNILQRDDSELVIDADFNIVCVGERLL